MELSEKPKLELAKKSLPRPLFQALEYIFSQGIARTMLVGGTALSGFYAGHRRSDDLDLFVVDSTALKSTVLAVLSLKKLGATFTSETRTQQYFKTTCSLDSHIFTVDVVEDFNLFEVGNFHRLKNKICVANLQTLLMTKCATLLSRCSEKDLYDLLWLFENIELKTEDLIKEGQKIDLGVNGESLLLSLCSAVLRKEACGFSMTQEPEIAIYRQIESLRKTLISNLNTYLKQQTSPPLKELIRRIRKLDRGR